ncbi:MAG: hypothetical protein ACI8P9_000432 [Parasphingorhabdus sp.]|jgi:hypothetical protein
MNIFLNNLTLKQIIGAVALVLSASNSAWACFDSSGSDVFCDSSSCDPVNSTAGGGQCISTPSMAPAPKPIPKPTPVTTSVATPEPVTVSAPPPASVPSESPATSPNSAQGNYLLTTVSEKYSDGTDILDLEYETLLPGLPSDPRWLAIVLGASNTDGEQTSSAIKSLFNLAPPLILSANLNTNKAFLNAEHIIQINWQRNDKNESGTIANYRIYSLQGDQLTLLSEVSGDTFSFFDRGVVKGEEFTYAITAVSGDGDESTPVYHTVHGDNSSHKAPVKAAEKKMIGDLEFHSIKEEVKGEVPLV